MKHLFTYQVHPTFPEPLQFLGKLSRNLWWSWNHDAMELFRRIDPRLWEASGQNPIVFNTRVSQTRLQDLATDEGFLTHLQRVQEEFDKRVGAPEKTSNSSGPGVVAYFSMEFGIHETLPLFAGGLGVLAGDHLKSASHLDLPLVGVGLLYRQGYFRQYLDMNGWQQESNPKTDLFHLPLTREKDDWGNGLRVSIDGPGGEIQADVWKVMVGRIRLFLLDTDIDENPAEARDITARLYPGEPATRLAQEVLLGIGGMRALTAMGIEPSVCHMNEGHSAFVTIARLMHYMNQHQLDLPAAMQVVPRTTVFTTHTPVAAGHDEFHPDLVRPFLAPLAEGLGISAEELLTWGQPEGGDAQAHFSMFILGLRMSQYCNGVSRLHGQVARRMWAHVWPNRSDEDTPITHVTNGVHVASFISPEIRMLFERYLGPRWDDGRDARRNIVDRTDDIYDDELWRAHEMARTRLISKVRELVLHQYGRRNAPLALMKSAESVLNQDVLTIGFARRFATYKRADLILKDPERLEALLTNADRPLQIIFAGKAHPRDNEGKQLIQRIIQFAQRPAVRNHIVFLEDYDMQIARFLVQGVDVWLNTPRRPMEACGTSGMKAAANGVLNLSILDGWWCEGYHPDRGWRIGSGESYHDGDYQDAVESQALYNILENDVIPCFYDRAKGNTPTTWIRKMKASIKMAINQFSSHRMAAEYDRRFYQAAFRQFDELLAGNGEKARHLSIQHERLKECWDDIHIEAPARDNEGPFNVQDTFNVSSAVHLGRLKPEEVDVELFYGRVKPDGSLAEAATMPMAVVDDRGQGAYLYRCAVTCADAGRYGFTVRVVAHADDWIRYTPKMLTWA